MQIYILYPPNDYSNIRYQNPPPVDCWPGLKHVYMIFQPTSRGLFAGAQPVDTVSEATPRGLFARAAACLHGLRSYLQGTVCWDVTCLYGLRSYLQGIVCQGCSLFPNLPKGDSW